MATTRKAVAKKVPARIYQPVAGYRVKRRGNTLVFGCGAVKVSTKNAENFLTRRITVVKNLRAEDRLEKRISKLRAERNAAEDNAAYRVVRYAIQNHGNLDNIDKSLPSITKNLLQP